MQDEKMIAAIRQAGIVQGAEQVEDRNRRLQETCGFRVADAAEYALIASCFSPYLSPRDMTAGTMNVHRSGTSAMLQGILNRVAAA